MPGMSWTRPPAPWASTSSGPTTISRTRCHEPLPETAHPAAEPVATAATPDHPEVAGWLGSAGGGGEAVPGRPVARTPAPSAAHPLQLRGAGLPVLGGMGAVVRRRTGRPDRPRGA